MGRAPHICAIPGCPRIVAHGGQCPEHPKVWANKPPDARRLNTASHRRLKQRVLRRDNYRCQIQYPDICKGVATDVDRIDNTDDYSIETCQSACHPCHLRKSSWEGHVASGHNSEHLKPPQHKQRSIPDQQQRQVPRSIGTSAKDVGTQSTDNIHDADSILDDWRKQ
jgi:5-methylcytosine-specific restriction enzyme A